MKNKSIRLKQARIATGKTQSEVAKALHIAVSTYKGWEADKEPRTLDTAAKLCGELNITLDYYVTGRERKQGLLKQEYQLIMKLRKMPSSIRKTICTLIKNIQ
ncbi:MULTISPECIES: helix-turn-helix transcriptional regulator [unclassified Neptuniibacter]|uniref:helix-turn-helix domain-containing protein n=1 Tax=unclassified Neptuniibacter TaxID=2630693 RepID=UPI000C5651A5|nr:MULTISPECIES: helix-turn-helix transcriptional regulator [unclassified Neptuniibacter]MAY42408.1 hypothetical protein [Oceanospirillaceae bacterium]